ncbi:hypothetical protein MKZ38_001092 [Zalerion maritima]|uniref:Enoyl reductase (ER) domain-containing protein n=1 Tax=Zalerion maritima TaxID=339359 RepID=A0AAD5RQP0_9PEZI|nr:hypothetical protein MKZ38_001092 [Zalerion maritima]
MSTSPPAAGSGMRGIVIEEHGGPEKLKYSTELPVPEMKDGEVLVKNEYIGVNYIDTYFRTGLYAAPLPLITGKEAAGTVASSSSPSFPTGTKVTYILDHSYAEYTAVPAAQLIPVPPGISTQTAAASLLQGLTALTFIRELPITPSEPKTVVVMAAAGGVGQWLVQILASEGHTVIAAAGSRTKVDLALALGAAHGINYSAEPLVDRIRELTKSHPLGGPDVMFDGVGKATFDGDLEVVARKGTLVIFGNASGAVPPVDLLRLAKKNTKVLRPTLFGYIATPEERQKYAKELWGLLEGKVKVSIHETYPMEEVRRAHEDLEGRKTMGKLVLQV